MEPQASYGSFGDQSTGKIYGRSRFGGKGCLGFIGGLVVLFIIIIAGSYFIYPALTPNTIHGDFMDMAIVPQKDGSQKLWVLTDGSFKFIQSSKSGGSYSSGVKCYACKTWTNIYDPLSEKVLKKITTEQQDVITNINIVYSNGKVWEITDAYHENEPKIAVYDAETSEQIIDTKQFVSKYPLLSGGLAGLRYDEKENTITFKTKDGRDQIIYSLKEDKMYSSQTEYINKMRTSSEIISVAVLANDESSKRKKLYKATGPDGKLYYKKSTYEDFGVNSNTTYSTDSIITEPMTERVFIEGIIYYQDKDCAVIIHLDQLGRKANRILTCVDMKTGKEKWTVQQDELFKSLKIDEDSDTFSDLFFTKNKIKVRRAGNLIVLERKDDGLMGFDLETGKKLWTMDI